MAFRFSRYHCSLQESCSNAAVTAFACIDEINRAVMEGKDDLVFELCKVFDHESYFDPIFDPPESFLQEC